MTRNIIQACHEQDVDIVSGSDFVLRQVRLHWIKGRISRSILVGLIALFACLITWRSNLNTILFSTQTLFALPIVLSEKVYLIRNVLKKIGVYEIIRLRGTEKQVILVDEGILQAAHNLFVHESVDVKMEHISRFLRSVPLPDVVVYLRQPESLLIDRTMKRGHKRIPDRSPQSVVRFVKRAVAVFENLVQNPAVESRLLVVGSGQGGIAVTDHVKDPLVGLVRKIIQNATLRQDRY